MNEEANALFDLTGRVSIVTGAAKGIGLGIAKNLALVGSKVVLVDIDEQGNCNAADMINDAGGEAMAVKCDMSHESDIRYLIKKVTTELGSIDVLVNNAAIYPMSPISEMPTELWDKVISVNLKGVFLLSREAFPLLKKSGNRGRLINISSINTWKSYVGQAHYDASKGGLEAFTRSCALELASFGVTANVIAPGAVKTPGSMTVRGGLATERGDDTTEFVDKDFASKIPLGAWASSDDIGQAVVLLACPAAHYITGQTIYVDGGLKLTM
jgi:NAD(P)-dependent dehydrogenase (short-subunit alcohol dehydrogenase family)